MGENMSFESDISTGGEIRGHLHGKDWPVGEPAGIKIINDDNCIHDSRFARIALLHTTFMICTSQQQSTVSKYS